MTEVFSNNTDKNITYNKKTIEKESNNISIPFSAIEDFYGVNTIFESNIYLVLRKFYNKTSEENKQKNGIKTTSEIIEEKIFNGKNRVEAVSELLYKQLKTRNLNLKDIKEIGIREGILVFKLNNGDEIYFNLDAKDILHLQVKDELKETKKDVENHISSYVIGGTIFTLTLAPIIGHEVRRVVKIILDNKGKKISLDLNEKINGEITEQKLIELIEKNGIEYNDETGKYEYKNIVDKIKESTFRNAFKELNYEKFKENLKKAGIEEIPTEKEFKKIKSDGEKFINKVAEKSKKAKGSFGKLLEKEFFKKINLKTIGEKSMHYALLPIFFQEMHKHNGSMNSKIHTGAEVLGFYGGAALFGRLLSIGGPKHPLVMLVGSLVGGAIGTQVTKSTLEHYDKELLSVMPNKDIEDGNKDIDWQIVTAGTIYDFLDKIDFDFTETYIDMSNNISSSTMPEFYLAKRFGGISHWNKELEQYKQKALKRIDELVYKDYRYRDILKDKEDLKEGLLNLFIGKSVGSVEKHRQTIYTPKVDKIIDFIEKNIPENLYCGDKEEYKKFEKQFKEFLKTILNSDKQIDLVLQKFKTDSEKEFLEKIEYITGNTKDLLKKSLGKTDELAYMNDIQKNALEKLNKIFYYEYSRYKKQNTPNYKVDEITFDVSKESDKKGEAYLNFIKNYFSLYIEKNYIDDNYIKKYKENLEIKKGFIELAFEGKLTTNPKGEKGKYVLLTDTNFSSIPVKRPDGKIDQAIIHNDNIKDILYINSLSEEDRYFIKNKIYKNILAGKSISKGSVGIHFVEPKFKKLIQNPQFYTFYKRLLIIAKQNFSVNNLEKHSDVVEWDERNSWLLHPINNFKRKVLKILDKSNRISYNKNII